MSEYGTELEQDIFEWQHAIVPAWSVETHRNAWKASTRSEQARLVALFGESFPEYKYTLEAMYAIARDAREDVRLRMEELYILDCLVHLRGVAEIIRNSKFVPGHLDTLDKLARAEQAIEDHTGLSLED